MPFAVRLPLTGPAYPFGSFGACFDEVIFHRPAQSHSPSELLAPPSAHQLIRSARQKSAQWWMRSAFRSATSLPPFLTRASIAQQGFRLMARCLQPRCRHAADAAARRRVWVPLRLFHSPLPGTVRARPRRSPPRDPLDGPQPASAGRVLPGSRREAASFTPGLSEIRVVVEAQRRSQCATSQPLFLTSPASPSPSGATLPSTAPF